MDIAKRRVLILAARGQLAQEILKAAPPESQCVALARPQIDICDAASLDAALSTQAPQLVINGAAYNLVDKAESDGAHHARRINFEGAQNLAAACASREIPLLHFSTDFVFDGEKRSPYTEDDAPHPLGVYAQSKLDGERAVLAASSQNWAVRVCRLFGIPEYSGNAQSGAAKPTGGFPFLMLRLARERGKVRVVNDQIGSPTYNPDLARAVWELIAKTSGGLYHLCNSGEVSFADYARETFRLADVKCEIEAVSSEEYGAPAKRPLYSTLSCEKAIGTGVSPLRHWRDALEEALRLAGELRTL